MKREGWGREGYGSAENVKELKKKNIYCGEGIDDTTAK